LVPVNKFGSNKNNLFHQRKFACLHSERLQAFYCAATLLCDPVDIRNALDAANTRVRTAIIPARFWLRWARCWSADCRRNYCCSDVGVFKTGPGQAVRSPSMVAPGGELLRCECGLQ
jgi:hypothetical protein